eukprot:TRINITY_DN709_c0_g2_i2.p1 TRINITY_DN709_c0_g2~~TRINITY_DN709_c0_g2_i2.p1  ORF type:complete len:231 (+),score=61.33 TRINITY_DN709_c0_g2_i2:62-754(+)
MGKLDVRIVGCRNLSNTETFGVSDPYVVVSCEGKKYRTTTKKQTLNPEWNEKFTFMLADEASARLEMEVWDANVMVDSPMGRYAVALDGLVRGVVSDKWYMLQGAKTGEIRVRVMAVDFGKSPAPSAPPQQTVSQAPPPQPQQPVYQYPPQPQPVYQAPYYPPQAPPSPPAAAYPPNYAYFPPPPQQAVPPPPLPYQAPLGYYPDPGYPTQGSGPVAPPPPAGYPPPMYY